MQLAAAFLLLLTLTDKPVTVSLPVPEAARTAHTSVLHMQNVEVNRQAPAVWNVFWEWPQATARTSVNDVHFAGYVALVPASAARSTKPLNFAMELPPAAVRALRRLRELRLTFVPVGRLPEGGVTIRNLRLE